MRTTSTIAGFYVILVVCVCACYASDAGTWEVISSSQQPSMLVDASVYSDSPRNRILYFGGTGYTISNISSALWSFDTISSSWVEINSTIVPAQRKGHSAVGYGGKMYVFGGLNTNQPFNDLWAFDLEENTWTQVQYADYNNVPYPRNGHFAATIGNEMWIFGGLYEYITSLTDVWAFDFLTSSWRMITPVINCPRVGNSHMISNGGTMNGAYYPSLNSVILYIPYPGLYEYHLDTNNCESLNISGAVLAPYGDFFTPTFALSSTVSISNPILYIFCQLPISWDFYTYSNLYAFDYDRQYMAALPQFEYPDQTTIQIQDMTIVSLNNTVYVSSYITDGSGNLQVAKYTPGCQNEACSGNGECIADAYCQCYNSSVGGYDCSAECLGSCGLGFCDYTYVQDNTSDPICKCPVNIMGDTCNITCPNCQNGICELELGSNTAVCACNQAFFGELCNETCPGQCNFHGTCNANLTCTCRDFWSGIDCMTDTRLCRVPQLACIENNTAPMSDLSWCSNQNVFIAPIKFQPTNASISSNITMACANSSDPMSTCKSIVQVCTAVAPSTTTTPHDEYVLMGLDTGDILIFDFNTEVILGELTLGNSSIEYLQGWLDFVNVIIAADENQFNVWQIFDNVSVSLAIEQTWAQDPSISVDDVLVSVNSFVSNYVPVVIPEAVVFQAVVASMFQNSQTGKYQLQYRQFTGTNFASIHPDRLIQPMNISTWRIESSLEFNSLNFYFTTQYSVGAPYAADSPACYCGSESRDLVIIYSEFHIAIYTNRAPNSTLQAGTYTLPFEAENAIYTAPPGFTITSVADFSSCCSNFNLPSEIRYLVVGLYDPDTSESRVDLYPLNELSHYDFSCYYEFDPNTPQLGLMVMRDSQGQCKDYFQNCNNNNTLYFNGSQCVPRDIDNLPTTIVPYSINIAYVGNPSGSAVDPTDFANYFDTVTNTTISSMMQSFGYNSIFITDTQQSVEVFGVQPASCGGSLNIKQMNNLEVASPIVDFWVTPNGQHVFIAAAKSNWELSSRLKLVEICEMLKNGDTSPFVLQYESYCIPPLGPPQPLGFGDFLLFVSMCNSGRYCPSFSSNTVNLVGPGNYTLMPGKVGPCVPQYYCPEGTLKECPIGYKCPEYGMMLPMKCARNQYQNTTCSQTGLVNEIPCPNGTICLTMDSPPIMVAPGYYVSESDPLAPGTPCQLGQFCPLGASSPPPLCPAGFYCPNASLTEPVACPTMYDVQGNQINNKTSYCPAGTFIPQLCPVGYYCTLPNQMTNCSNGDYCPEGTQIAQPCPAGSVCETPATISKCPHNHVCPGGTYIPQKCSIFEYCPKGSSAQRQWTILAGELVILLLIFIAFRIYSVCVRQRHDRKAGELIFDSHKSTNRFKKPTARESDALLSISNKWQQSGFLIQFEKLSLTLGKDKQVLKGVSGTFIPGRLTAIMGPSGAGKTTLLQVLSGRVKHTGGSLLINGKPDGMEQYKTVFGFVPQEDIMLRSLTVKEILEFSTATRLPPSISKKERTMLIMDILDVLGLSHVRYSPIGDDEQRGVSGGERKRVNIGMELAAEPAVLFLDEPTSGLDSTSATQVMQCLKNVAEMGITVVCVIHQPRVEVFEMIDNVLLLGVGGVSVYQGEASKAINYFNDVLHFAPKKSSTNPADYLMDAICNKIPRSETEPIEEVWRSNLQSSVPVINNSFVSFKPRKMPNPMWQLILFMHRSGSLIVRDMYSVILNIVLVFVSGLLAGFVYSSNSGFIGPMSADEQARCPGPMQKVCELPLNDSYVIQFCLLNMAAGMTAVASSLRHFGDERVIYWREATTGTSSLAYFIGKNIASIPLMIICPFILISVYYMLVALQHNFWHMYFILLLTQFTCVGAGHLISLVISPQNSLLAGVVYVIVSTLFCGANPALSKLNSYGIPAKILTSLSYSRWSTEGLYILALRPFEHVYNLDSAFDFWGYKRDFLMKDMLGLMALGIFFRILAFLALLIFHKYRKAK